MHVVLSFFPFVQSYSHSARSSGVVSHSRRPDWGFSLGEQFFPSSLCHCGCGSFHGVLYSQWHQIFVFDILRYTWSQAVVGFSEQAYPNITVDNWDLNRILGDGHFVASVDGLPCVGGISRTTFTGWCHVFSICLEQMIWGHFPIWLKGLSCVFPCFVEMNSEKKTKF